MSRPIDADALIDGYKHMGYDPSEHPEESYMEGWCKGFNSAVDHCIHHVIHAPTIEPENGIPKDAIEYILRKETVSTNPDDFTANEKFIKFMDDPEIASFGRWQHANGFNTALVAVKCDLDKIPDSEPERETGKWIAIVAELGAHKIIVEGYNCSKCGRYDAEKDNFCPDCGAKMEGK